MSRVVSQLGEFGLIGTLAKALPAVPSGWIGVGDDCAVVPPDALSSDNWQVVTTDSLVEGVHFRRSTAGAYTIGWKLLAVSISDICAMAATPIGAVISIHLPNSTEVEWMKEFYRGVSDLATREGVFVLGGDTVKSTELAFCLTAWGTASKAPVLRSGAQPGDDIWVSGEIGASYLGFEILEGRLSPTELSDGGKRVIAAHCSPQPRSDVAHYLLARDDIHSMIDVSDGLLQDAQHLVTSGGLDLLIDITTVPFAAEATALGVAPPQLLTGGEDYELLFTASPSLRGVAELRESARIIGSVPGSSQGELLIQDGAIALRLSDWLRREGLTVAGFDHFGSGR